MRLMRMMLIVCSVAALAVAGCSKPAETPKPSVGQSPIAPKAPPEAKATDAPKPAASAVPAAEKAAPAVPGPVKLAEVNTNLLENGDFSQWPDGTRIPVGWTHGYGYPTVEEMPSSIEPFSEGTYDKWRAAKQTWKKADGDDSIFRQFGVTVEGLKPNTQYRLELKALSQSKAAVVVQPWAIPADAQNPPSAPSEPKAKDEPKTKEKGGKASKKAPGAPQVTRLATIEVKPGAEFADYVGAFTTNEETTVRLVTACAEADSFPVSVVWDRWILTEAAPQPDNLIPNADFAQWPDGVRVPKGFTHGVGYEISDMPSSIERVTPDTLPGVVVQQIWSKDDGADSVFRQFGISVEGLKPNTLYRLRVKAYNKSTDAVVSVNPWSVDAEQKSAALLVRPAVEVKPGAGFGFLDYEVGFQTGPADTNVRITSSCSTDKLPVTVLWKEWSLTEAQEAK